MKKLLLVNCQSTTQEVIQDLMSRANTIIESVKIKDAINVMKRTTGLAIIETSDDFQIPIDQLAKANPNCPVIVLSGLGNGEAIIRSMGAGAYDYLPKPIVPELLEKAINQGFELQRGSSDQAAKPPPKTPRKPAK